MARFRTSLGALALLALLASLAYVSGQSRGSWHTQRQTEVPDSAIRMAMRELKATGKGAASNKPLTVTFNLLKSWVYLERDKTPLPGFIRELDGKTVEMTGFMIPITEVKNIQHFILASSLQGCCYGQPLAVNHIMFVNMVKGKTTDYATDPLLIRGVFHAEESRVDGDLISLYSISADTVEPAPTLASDPSQYVAFPVNPQPK